MARSDIRTWLSLDEWNKITGGNPLHFNQFFSNTMFVGTQCGTPWFQDSFVNADRVGRDELAMAIQAAELEISREVGYNLIPDWTVDERLDYPRPGRPEAFGGGLNPRWMLKSVEALRGHLISGGIRTKSLIEMVAPVVRSDQDGDGYDETCTVTVAVTITDTNEIHAYYPGKDGSDGWEIRPVTVAISGGLATIQFKSWQIPAGNKLEQPDAQPLDADDPVNYEGSVDVYRVYNYPGTQVQLLWESNGTGYCGTCSACLLNTQDGCFHLRDARLGILVPAPASWDSRTETFTSLEFSMCREPDQVRLWYYSGYRDNTLARPYVEMSPYWKYAVAYFAASKLDRPVCGCSNVAEFISKWQRDAMYSSEAMGNMIITPDFASNKLGTSIGALYAYRRVQANGVKVNK